MSHETLYTTRKFVLEKRIITVKGQSRTVHIIRHPGVAVILGLLDDGRIAAITCYREAAGEHLIELPAGTLDPDESPIDCARRELAEETGYRAATLEPLVSFLPSPGFLTERMHVFLATGLTPGPTALGAGEDIQPHPMTLDEGLEAIRDGRIKDAKTMIALMYFDRFRRDRGTA